MRAILPSIRLPGASRPPTAPAIVLVEILVAALIIAAAAALFLSVLSESRLGLAQSRSRLQALAIAADLLGSAQTRRPPFQLHGAQARHLWTLSCADTALRSPRLGLMLCEAKVTWRGPLGATRELALSRATARRLSPPP